MIDAAVAEAFQRIPEDLAGVVTLVEVASSGQVTVHLGKRKAVLHPEPWHARRPALAAEQMWETIREDGKRTSDEPYAVVHMGDPPS